MSNQEDEENPMASVAANDIFVFAPTAATIVVMLAMLFGAAKVTVDMASHLTGSLTGIAGLAVTFGLTLVYSGIAVAIVYQDNGVEVPLPSF
jgi:hypothetical protein